MVVLWPERLVVPCWRSSRISIQKTLWKLHCWHVLEQSSASRSRSDWNGYRGNSEVGRQPSKHEGFRKREPSFFVAIDKIDHKEKRKKESKSAGGRGKQSKEERNKWRHAGGLCLCRSSLLCFCDGLSKPDYICGSFWAWVRLHYGHFLYLLKHTHYKQL